MPEVRAQPVCIIVPGRPVPKARPRLAVRGRTAYVYTPPETVAYQEFVRMCALTRFRKPIEGPVGMRIALYFAGKRTPDLTNVVKAIEDGMTGVAYMDDGQVKCLIAEMKQVESRSEERAEVEVWELEAVEDAV